MYAFVKWQPSEFVVTWTRKRMSTTATLATTNCNVHSPIHIIRVGNVSSFSSVYLLPRRTSHYNHFMWFVALFFLCLFVCVCCSHKYNSSMFFGRIHIAINNDAISFYVISHLVCLYHCLSGFLLGYTTWYTKMSSVVKPNCDMHLIFFRTQKKNLEWKSEVFFVAWIRKHLSSHSAARHWKKELFSWFSFFSLMILFRHLLSFK